MTWKCDCGASNVWWKDSCESCGKGQPGFDDRPVGASATITLEFDIDGFLKAAREAEDTLRLYNDCGCPAYGFCHRPVCPRRIQSS